MRPVEAGLGTTSRLGLCLAGPREGKEPMRKRPAKPKPAEPPKPAIPAKEQQILADIYRTLRRMYSKRKDGKR